jgi:very-short-patch-repair endonuclease
MRLDLAYPDILVGIEGDSERWHTSRARFQGDRTKRAIAESLGWTILAFTHRHAVRQPSFVAETVARTLSHRGVVLLSRSGG